jgi:glycosyltransferase involved in cell wall biosynthesis
MTRVLPEVVQRKDGLRQESLPRLCILIEDFYPVMHGATTQFLMLGERFAARGVGVLVVTRRIEPHHAREETLPGLVVVRVPPTVGLHRAGKFLMVPGALWVLFRQRARYDVLVVSDVKVLGPAGVLAARLLGKPCVLRAESCGELDITEWLAANRRAHPILSRVARLLLPLRNLWLRQADRFLSISSAITAEFLSTGMPSSRIVEITNGIDAERFTPVSPTEKPLLRRRLALPEGWLLVYTGRLAEGKGLRWLLDIWSRFAAENPDAHLMLVGSGQKFGADIEAELHRLVRERGLATRVTFTGAVPNVAEYLQAADCFVLPSRSESLGISLLEAMACGLPCVATGVGGILDIVEDGSNGLLVPYRDDERLYAALGRIFESPALAARLGEEGRATIVRRFHVDAIVDRYVTLLEEIGLK